jgi:hypothetical protein
MNELAEISELITDLYWVSETDEPWTVETSDNLEPIESKDFKTVEFDKFFSQATQSQSWHGEQENQEVQQYQNLVQWLKANLTEVRVYKIGDVNIDIYVVGRLNDKWLILTTKAVET